MLTRRDLLRGAGAAGVVAFTRGLNAQAPQAAPPPPAPFQPNRDFSPDGLQSYPDPDILTIDPAFNALRVNNTPIRRLWTGGLWCEGPAWSSQGRYLVWSDIPNNRQMRWLEDDGRVTVFRMPSNNSNGNTFDLRGPSDFVRARHAPRRAVRERRHRSPCWPIATTACGSIHRTTSRRIPTAATGSPIPRSEDRCTKARRTRPAVRATRRAGSIHAPVSSPVTAKPNAS